MKRENKKRWEKIKKLNLKWYAFESKSAMGSREKAGLEITNVLRGEILYDVDKLISENATYDEIKKELRSWLMYYFWSKSEHEVIVSNWVGYDFEEKIDIWYQLYPNIDRITEYVLINLAPVKYKEIMKTRKDFSENTYL